METLGLLIDSCLDRIKLERRAQKPQPQFAEVNSGVAIAAMTNRALPELKADQKLLQAARAANEKARSEEAHRAALAAASATSEDTL